MTADHTPDRTDDRGYLLKCGCYDTEHVINGYCKHKYDGYKRELRRKRQAKEKGRIK